MAFVSGSSQYASKANPSGLTQTDDITFETEIFVDSYTTAGVIGSMQNTSSTGWRALLQASGQLTIYGYNAGSYRGFTTAQSIPMNKWTHIAFTLDMSGYTTATCKIYMDGIDMPVTFDASGTPTSFASPVGGTLALGNSVASPGFINGKLANTRLWSVLRTTAQIRDNMNQETLASTTGLVGHWKGNGSWNDSSVNANHLTAVNGAVNNFASHPYSATEYAIATRVQYTGGNTDVTIFTGSGALPNETLVTTSYSNDRSPYGFPSDRSKWRLTSLDRSGLAQASPIANTWYNYSTLRLPVPTGAWDMSYHTNFFIDAPSGTIGTTNLSLTAASIVPLSTKASSVSYSQSGGGLISKHYGMETLVATTQTPVYLNGCFSGNGTTMVNYTTQSQGGAAIYADCAYL
jgi:hypothetical protein